MRGVGYPGVILATARRGALNIAPTNCQSGNTSPWSLSEQSYIATYPEVPGICSNKSLKASCSTLASSRRSLKHQRLSSADLPLIPKYWAPTSPPDLN